MRDVAAAGLVALYFIWFAGRWIGSGFTPDDLMNCHRALEQPLWKLLLDHVTVYLPTTEYRPFGSLFYRALYRSFGFQPLPFHIALYAVLAANIYLTYSVVRRLTGVTAAAWAAAVFHAWHGNWTGLHLSVGFCFDVLCYFFYAAALIAFDAGRRWLFLGLFILGLNSKEMAVSLPLVCLVWKGGQCARSATAALTAGLIAMAFIGGRLMAPGGLGGMEPYAPRFDLATVFSRLDGFLEMAAYGRGGMVWAFLVLLGATAWSVMYHRRAAVVALVLSGAGALPVAVIPQRSLESLYVPALGVVALLALPLAALCRRSPLGSTVAAVLLAGTFHQLGSDPDPDGRLAEARHIGDVTRQIRQAAPSLPRGASIHFTRDPFPRFDWNSYFLIRLLYDDPTVKVDRPGRETSATYDVSWDWDDGGGPGHGFLRRRSLEATRASTAPKSTPSK